MTITALLSIGVGLAYVGLATVRFAVVTEAVLRYAYALGIPHILPGWFSPRARVLFPHFFRWSSRLFFVGCAYTHFEIAAHILVIGDFPPEYGSLNHQLVMGGQLIGAWVFVASLGLISSALKRETPNVS